MISRVHFLHDRKETTFLCSLKEKKKERKNRRERRFLSNWKWGSGNDVVVCFISGFRFFPFFSFFFFLILLCFQSSSPLRKWQNRETCRFFFCFLPPPQFYNERRTNQIKRRRWKVSLSRKKREKKTAEDAFFFRVPPSVLDAAVSGSIVVMCHCHGWGMGVIIGCGGPFSQRWGVQRLGGRVACEGLDSSHSHNYFLKFSLLNPWKKADQRVGDTRHTHSHMQTQKGIKKN